MKIKTLTIDELCNVEYGTRVTRKKDSRDSGKIYPVYGGGGETFFIDKTNRKNRVVIARFAMSEKCTRFVKGDFFLNDSGLTLSPKTSELSQEYLDKIILVLNYSIYQLGRGTAQRNLDMKKFRLLKISFPTSLVEQQRIVVKLNAAFAEIDKNIDIIENKKKQTQNLLDSVFNNKIYKKEKKFKISDVCLNITDGSHFSPKTISNGYPYITVRDISNDKINFSKCKFINKDNFNKLKKNNCSPKKNDLLFSKDGTVGKVAIVKDDTEFVVLSSLAILNCNQNLIIPEYLFYVLKSPSFLKEATGKKTGAAIRRIILKNLKNIKISLPDLRNQKKIIHQLNEITDVISNYIKLITKQQSLYELLKKSLLSKFLKNESA